jgi:hypothetical protein
MTTPSDVELENARLEFEREKWRAEYDLRRAEISLKRDEVNRSRWINPLVIAVFAAAAAALGNAGVTLISGYQQRTLEETQAADTRVLNLNQSIATLQLEQSKAESARILEVVKTSDPDKAAVNLKFLIDTGLIADQNIRRQIESYLDKRAPGKGFSLPSSGSIGPAGTCSISGGGATFEIKNISEYGCKAAAEASGVTYKWMPNNN